MRVVDVRPTGRGGAPFIPCGAGCDGGGIEPMGCGDPPCSLKELRDCRRVLSTSGNRWLPLLTGMLLNAGFSALQSRDASMRSSASGLSGARVMLRSSEAVPSSVLRTSVMTFRS